MAPRRSKQTAPLITVLGFGNVLARDEGVGPKVIEQLAKEGVASSVRLVDLGSGGMSLLDYFEGSDLLILVDCALMDMQPGSIRVFEPSEVESRRQGEKDFSLHSGDLLALIELGRRLYSVPPIRIVGVQPAVVESGLGLSEALQQKIPQIVKAVRQEIDRASAQRSSRAERDGRKS